MDKIEQFRHLKEIQSLDNLILAAKTEIETAQKRINFVEETFHNTQTELDDLSRELISFKKQTGVLEAELDQVINKQESDKENALSLTSQAQLDAFNQQAQSSQEKRDLLEEEVMALMEQIEEKETLQKEKQNFLKGQQGTLNDIGKEVEDQMALKEKEIGQLQKRVDLLIEGLDERFSLVFKNSYAQLRHKSPLTKLDKENCAKCFYKIDKVTQHSVEFDHNIHQCVSCKRIFVPHPANS